MIPDILSSRYSSKKINEIWSPQGKIILERKFWIVVMKEQKKLGIDIPDSAIKAYEEVCNIVDLKSIEKIEKKLRHDVNSRIQEFCRLAGYKHVHKGMTSRDLTDNVEQLQILRSLRIIRTKTIAVLHKLSQWSLKTKDIIISSRTHNVPAQPSTLGKRLSIFGEEILFALKRLDHLIKNYPIRGLQGAIGTQLDQMVLLKGDKKKVKKLSEQIAKYFGCKNYINSVGQIYPRSLDMEVVNGLIAVSSGISNFAKTMRLMSGQGLVSEGFKKEQIGSSVMPHKINARTSERINGFHNILKGYGTMLTGLSGDQWNEGDVSCSVVRRVALPGSFFASDGQLEASLTVLSEMEFFETMIERELKTFLPFMASTRLVMESINKGSPREIVYEAIKEHSKETSKKIRTETSKENDLIHRIARDERIPLNLKEIQSILEDPKNFIACSSKQSKKFTSEVCKWTRKYPEAKKIAPQTLI